MTPSEPALRVFGAIRWVAALLAVGCAGTSWPDEPGVPLEVVRLDNLDAENAFWATLTSRRQATKLPPLMVADRYQSEIRVIADDLQRGRISASGARDAALRWGRSAYGLEVESYALDCAPGPSMRIPDSLVEASSAAIAYAAAHFRPKSSSAVQCAVLVVVPSGSDVIESAKPSGGG